MHILQPKYSTYMVFKEGGQSKRVHSERERERQREGLKDGARMACFGMGHTYCGGVMIPTLLI